MKKLVYILAGAALIVAAGSVTKSDALSVTASSDGAILAQTILGSGISVSNVVYSGAAVASGTFTGGNSSGIGIDKGIILTSGSAVGAQGPNNIGSYSVANGNAGNASLNSLIPGYSTHDAAVLSFDFQSSGGNVFFKYAFASEEYNEYTNTSFNDVFGFFLDGKNIALIPGTTTPVSINNVNGGNPLGTNAKNSQYFTNNDNGTFNLQYDGFTKVFVAEGLNLGIGTHHIDLAIADAGDSILDSGVFIQAGSFSDTNPVPEPSTLLLLGAGFAGLGFARRKFKK